MKPHTKREPCAICGGCRELAPGQGRRCWGFLSDDGAYAHCSREEHAGELSINDSSMTYAHKLAGKCHCGKEHGPANVEPIGRAAREIVATYDYVDESGALLFQVVRMHPKDFRQRRPDGRGGWAWKVEDVRVVPYRLPELIAAVAAGDTVYIAEGEKDVEAIRAAGHPATCNAGGAGKWRAEFSRYFTGAHVVIVRDKDGPGNDHARAVFKSLRGVAADVRVVEARTGKDSADHLAAGHTLAEWVAVYPPDENLRVTDPVAWKRRALRLSFDETEPIVEVDAAKALARPLAPRWPTGLEHEGWISLTAFAGVVIFAGIPSAAKSVLAMASGINAARAGWDVLYLSAEMSEQVLAKRVSEYLCGSESPATFRHLDVRFGASIEGLVDWIEAKLSERPTLVIFDSVTSFCDQAKAQDARDPHGFLLSRKIVMWAINCRSRTDGQLAFLLLAEASKEGRMRGRTADHKADMALLMESDKDAPSTKIVTVTKAWESATGKVGRFGLDARTWRLRRLE